MWKQALLTSTLILAGCSGGGGGSPASPPVSMSPSPTPLPPPPPPPPPPPEPCKRVFLGAGQSNMLGSNLDTTGNANTDDRVFAWEIDGQQFSQSELGQDPYRVIDFNMGMVSANNILHNFGLRVAQETDCNVYLILVGQGGQPIEEADGTGWINVDGSKGEQTIKIEDNVSVALDALNLETINGILWHQGESDDDRPDVYGTFWEGVIEFWRSNEWADENTPIFAIELIEGFGAVNPSIEMIAVSDPAIIFVETDGEFDDGVFAFHWSGFSLQNIGFERVWNAYKEATN